MWARGSKSAEAMIPGVPETTRYDFPGGTLLAGGPDVTLPSGFRAGLVAENGVSQAIRPHVLNEGGFVASLSDAALPPGMPDYAGGVLADVRPPVRAGLNTAGFGELYRAFWNVMVDRAGMEDPTDTADPPLTAAAGYQNGTFAAPAPSGGGAPPDDVFDPSKVGPVDTRREQVVLLRAALAAVNAMDIRDVEHPGDPGDADITVAEVPLSYLRFGSLPYQPDPTLADFNEFLPYDPSDPYDNGSAYSAATPVSSRQLTARVFGTEAQPFITEVIAQWNAAGDDLDYLAVELMNPYPFDLKMRGWRLVAFNPTTGAMTDLAVFGEYGAVGDTMPASAGDRDGNMVIEPQVFPSAYDDAGTPADTTDDTYAPHRFVLEFGTRPTGPEGVTVQAASDDAATISDGGGSLADGMISDDPTAPRVPDGHTFFAPPLPGGVEPFTLLTADHRLVLLRPADNDAPAPPPVTPVAAYAAAVRADFNLVPLDAVDLRGLESFADRRIRYSRDDTNRNWQFVFHGRYEEDNLALPLNDEAVSEGVQVFDTPAATPDYQGELGVVNTTITVNMVNAGVTATGGFPVGPVLGGPIFRALPGAGVVNAEEPSHPYGGFARDGDAYAIPILGGYTLFYDGGPGGNTQIPDGDSLGATFDGLQADAEILKMTPVTFDTEHSDTDANDLWGRFVFNEGGIPGDGTIQTIDADGSGDDGDPVYAWASDLTEYVTALDNFGDDAMPNVDLRYGFDPVVGAGVRDESLNATDALPAAMLTTLYFEGTPSATTPVDTLFGDLTPTVAVNPDPFFGPVPIDNDGDGLAGLQVPAAAGDPDEAAVARYAEAFEPARGKVNVLTANDGILRAVPLDVGDVPTAPLFLGRVDPADSGAGSTMEAVTTTAASLALLTDGVSNRRQPYLGGVAAPVQTLADLVSALPENGAERYARGDLSGRLPVPRDVDGNGTVEQVELLDTPNFYDRDPDTAPSPDYEAVTTDLARVGNLLTTRSDSYTVYLVVQAWENFGSNGTSRPTARLVRQERVAFVVDRSGVLPPGHGMGDLAGADAASYATADDAIAALKITPVPTD